MSSARSTVCPDLVSRVVGTADRLIGQPSVESDMGLKDVVAVVSDLPRSLLSAFERGVYRDQVLFEDIRGAASEILLGGLDSPRVETSGWTIDETNSALDTVAFTGEVRVDNSVNSVGASVEVVEYEAYASGDSYAGFEKVGEGEIEDIYLPPGGEAVGRISFQSGSAEFLAAVGAAGLDALVTREVYIRLEGVARLSLGPFSYQMEFSPVGRLA